MFEKSLTAPKKLKRDSLGSSGFVYVMPTYAVPGLLTLPKTTLKKN